LASTRGQRLPCKPIKAEVIATRPASPVTLTGSERQLSRPVPEGSQPNIHHNRPLAHPLPWAGAIDI
jgi:hypothetical protein